MAPAKAGSAVASTTPAAVTSQRTIASFFGTKSATGGSTKAEKKTPKQKVTLSIPSEGGLQPHSSPSKRARVNTVKSISSSPVSPDSKGTNAAKKKNSDWLSTPSPSESVKPVTKTFGRRDRKSLKSGVVAPVLASVTEVDMTKPKKSEKGATSPESLIGKRLKVFWPLDKVWYSGRIKSYSKSLGSHVIRYDDGEDEKVVLDKEKVKWLDEPESPAPKATTKRTQGRSTGSKTKSPSALKRKIAEDDIEDDIEDVTEDDVDSLLHELKNGLDDDGQSKTPKKGKRARLDVVKDDRPAEVPAVSSDLFDEVDVEIPDEEQIAPVRKRLRKQVRSSTPVKKEANAGFTEPMNLEDEEESKTKRGQPKRAATSARRLQLEEVGGDDEKLPSEKSTSSDSDSKPLSTKKISTSKSDRVVKTPQASDFFTKLSAKPTKKAADNSSPPLLKSISSIPKEDYRIRPQEVDADKMMRGELHSTLVGEHADRFGGRMEEKFKFLGKGRKDASGRRPTDPDFDARTVHLPPDFVKGLSGGQRQWWEFKSKHMEKVLLFKMGKFYELFEMDAHIGAQELDLQYMKGEQPHCGFPEKLYFECAEKLARKGYRVLVVEQTETPDQLEQRRRETGAKDKVVKREICAVLTKGTLVDGEMLTVSPDAAYVMSITEMASSSSELSASEMTATIGVCLVDTSTSHIMLGQFDDDSARSRLRSVLSEFRPVELVKPRGVLTEATERAIKDHTRQPLINCLVPGKEFWDAKESLKQILEVYASFKSPKATIKSTEKLATKESPQIFAEPLEMLPEVIKQVVAAGSRGEVALSSIGGMLFYLREALLDQTLLRLGRIDVLQGSDPFEGPLGSQSNEEEPMEIDMAGDQNSESSAQTRGERLEPYMVLDSAALENLEILENNQDGGTSGTLLAHLDSCVTPYGRRLLRQWLVRPLMETESILQRQQATLDLKDIAAEAAVNFRKELKGQSDMERLLARLHACSGASGRNADNVVLYEDAAKKQLQEFMGALRGCRALLLAIKSFESCSSELTSSRLKALVTPGLGVPDMTPIIENFETAFDREEAEKTGRIVPVEGVDEDFDEGDSAVKSALKKLADYLSKQRKKFGNSSEIKYVTVGKESYQMEIPEEYHTKVPSSYEVKSSRKGFRRYWTPEIKELLQDLTAGEQQRELALRGILQGLVKRFCEDYSKWLALVKSVAEIDVLISLSEASVNSSPTCRPTFTNLRSETDSCSPRIVAKDIRHPTVCTNLAGGGAFVPNDVSIGGTAPPFMLLTGPNMGGKSTLIRQVCLAVVLAQVGANVTAEQFELSPVDRVFVRMGAKDHIMAGQSTFLVELSETASMLRSATTSSLVALDELGRGTSTSDGQAIAHAVLHHLAHNVACRGMFSTHYHRLATHFSLDPKVGLHHMSCKVGTGIDGVEEVTFLYKLDIGACPKSYGVNVARLAGMPESVLHRASARAAELELSWDKAAADKNKGDSLNLSDAEPDTDGNVMSNGTETKAATAIVGLLKKIPATGATGVSFDSISQIWQAAHELLHLNKTTEQCAEA